MSDLPDSGLVAEEQLTQASGARWFETLAIVGAVAAVCVGLYLSSLYSYLLFHGLVEISTTAIGFMLFVLVWNTRRFYSNGFLSILGIGYASIAFLDLIHTLAYKGMGVFAGYDANLPTQLWIAARYLQAFTILAALLFIDRKVDNRAVLGVYAILVSAVTALVFSGYFPDAYVEGSGLTSFKVNSEYVITALLLVALYSLFRHRKHFDATVYHLVGASVLCTVFSELSFTAYISVYGFANLFGHLLKLAAFYLIYRAILVTGFQTPFDFIFRSLSQANDELRVTSEHLAEEIGQRETVEEELRESRDELELRVQERTRAFRVLSESNQMLMHATDEGRLLEDVCRIVVEIGGYALCWVGVVEHDEEKSVRPVASAGAEADYVEHIKVTWGPEPTGQGPSGRSIREKSPVAVRDLRGDPLYAPWVEEATRRGLESSISLPLLDSSGEAFGTIAIYSDRPQSFDTEEVGLLAELAGDVAFGVRTLRERQAGARLAAIVTSSQDAIFIESLEAVVTSWNAAAETLYGYSAEEMIGRTVEEVLAPPDRMDEPRRLVERVRRGERITGHETQRRRKDGGLVDVSLTLSPIRDEAGAIVAVSVIGHDVTESKQAERERLARFRVVESMDRINRAIQGADDLDRMMSDTLDEVLSIFECDRAFLMHPCDPDSPTWTVPMERSRPEYPGVLALGLEMPMSDEVAETLRILLAADGPVRFGPGSAHPLPEDVSERFGFKSFMSAALYPRIGKPWQFGLHQCSYAREWTDEEADLLREIGRRLEDALSTLLIHRDLKRSETEYRRLIETASEGVSQLDKNAVVTFVNARLTEMLGYAADEMVGHPFTDFMVDEELADHKVRMRNRRRGVSEEYDRRFRHKDGRVVWAHVSASPIVDEAGEIAGAFGMLTDITEAKRAEAERADRLRFVESMDRVNRAIQGTNDLEQMMSDVLDEMLSILECDRAFLLYPCDPDSPTWAVPMERTRPEYPGIAALGIDMPMGPDTARTHRVLLDSDGPVRFGPGAGHELPAQVSERFAFKSLMSVVLRPRVGKPWEFGLQQCAYAREWTDDEVDLLREVGRRLEDALSTLLAHRDLQRSEAKYRRIIETATEGVWVLGPDTMTTFVNARMADMLGVPEAAMTGRPVTDFMFEEDAPDHLAKMENRRRGVSEEYERRFRRDGGEEVWTHVSAVPIFDDEGRFDGSMAMFTDITERKLAEDALRRRNEELERFERVVVGRELRMRELKDRVVQLEHALAHDRREDDGES